MEDANRCFRALTISLINILHPYFQSIISLAFMAPKRPSMKSIAAAKKAFATDHEARVAEIAAMTEALAVEQEQFQAEQEAAEELCKTRTKRHYEQIAKKAWLASKKCTMGEFVDGFRSRIFDWMDDERNLGFKPPKDPAYNNGECHQNDFQVIHDRMQTLMDQDDHQLEVMCDLLRVPILRQLDDRGFKKRRLRR